MRSFNKIRELCEENNIKFTIVKQRLYRGIPLKYALLKDCYDILAKEKEELKKKPMRYWIIKDNKITTEMRYD